MHIDSQHIECLGGYIISYDYFNWLISQMKYSLGYEVVDADDDDPLNELVSYLEFYMVIDLPIPLSHDCIIFWVGPDKIITKKLNKRPYWKY